MDDGRYRWERPYSLYAHDHGSELARGSLEVGLVQNSCEDWQEEPLFARLNQAGEVQRSST